MCVCFSRLVPLNPPTTTAWQNSSWTWYIRSCSRRRNRALPAATAAAAAATVLAAAATPRLVAVARPRPQPPPPPRPLWHLPRRKPGPCRYVHTQYIISRFMFWSTCYDWMDLDILNSKRAIFVLFDHLPAFGPIGKAVTPRLCRAKCQKLEH